MALFRFLTAQEWGMTWKRPAVPEKLNDPEVYVHHSAGGLLATDAVAAFRLLNRFAQEGKDYSALDYDILVHRDPASGLVTVGGGREEWRSAATLNRNELGEAICVIGYLHPGHVLSRRPHPDEVEGVARGIVWGIDQGWIARDARILGHRDNLAFEDGQPTACPGNWMYGKLPLVRARVASILAGDSTPTPGPGPASPTMLEGDIEMWLVAKVKDGPHLAARGIGAGALHVSSQVPLEYVFADGGGEAFDLGAMEPIGIGSWGAVKAVRTLDEVEQFMGAYNPPG